MGLDSREYDPRDSMEDLPLENEQDELELLNDELTRTKQRLDYKIFQLQKLAQFEESIRTFGSLTHKEQTEKNEILKQYLK